MKRAALVLAGLSVAMLHAPDLAAAASYAGSHTCSSNKSRFQVVRNYKVYHQQGTDPSRRKIVSIRGWIAPLIDNGAVKRMEVSPRRSRYNLSGKHHSFGGMITRVGKDMTIDVNVQLMGGRGAHVLLCAYAVQRTPTIPKVRNLAKLYSGSGQSISARGTASISLATLPGYSTVYFTVIVEPKVRGDRLTYRLSARPKGAGTSSSSSSGSSSGSGGAATGKYAQTIEAWIRSKGGPLQSYSKAFVRKLAEVAGRSGAALPHIAGFRTTRQQAQAMYNNWRWAYRNKGGLSGAKAWTHSVYGAGWYGRTLHDWFSKVNSRRATFEKWHAWFAKYVTTSNIASHSNGRAFDVTPYTASVRRLLEKTLSEGVSQGLFKPFKGVGIVAEKNHYHIQLSPP